MAEAINTAMQVQAPPNQLAVAIKMNLKRSESVTVQHVYSHYLVANYSDLYLNTNLIDENYVHVLQQHHTSVA